MKLNQLLDSKIRMKSFSKKFLADMDTPVSTYHKLSDQPYSFLLESMEGDGQRGRYSVIGMKPLLIFKRLSNHTIIESPHSEDQLDLGDGNPFDHLKWILTKFEFDRTALFECGFLCGYISYDAVRHIEQIPAKSRVDLQLPEILLVLPTQIIIFDNFNHTLQLIIHFEDGSAPKQLAERADAFFEMTLKKFSLHQPRIREIQGNPKASAPGVWFNMTDENYLQSVVRAKEYIRNGDIFQVVLSRRFHGSIHCGGFDVFRMLRLINPSPYMFYLNFNGLELVGSSPETMVKYDGSRVMVRPIAGTRRRGQTPDEDRKIAAELLHDEKELAEHVMLVDLGRNDIGRVARYGTVKVDVLKHVENYSHVMHIVSTVTGELQPGFDSVDVFKACFPAGTVTGAPKVRAMEIIDELETTQRGFYAGAVGYFDFCGRMDTCIAIRTMLIKNKIAYWQAGAGIVADSVPEKELEETGNKARALFKAILMAEEAHDDCRD
ncbi:MAG: anthranilate synthase component I [candidate division KSB1 bacterium]|nr:anthranilate synthase component I [candidate division KSB1 bacterium]